MTPFPFAAIVGMQDAKRSLIYHAIDPNLGGALLLGHRGCAKTTLVRGFAEVLQAASSQPTPFVELPLGTTEDRLLGSVDAEALVERDRWETRIGLIEEANGGVLYVDEINLLPDHLADQLLDSAASGKYHLERDGVTRRTESQYILVGTMNPDEGDLRPQILDRFAHGIVIKDEFAPEQRMEVVRRRMEFDDDPDAFAQLHAAALTDLAERLGNARALLRRVAVPEQQRREIADEARRLQLGLRPELAVLRTARCAAAWENRLSIGPQDLQEAWRMCLGHRRPENRAQAPGSPPSPPPSGNRFHPPSGRTSAAPADSLPEPKPVAEPKPLANELLRRWMNAGSARAQDDERGAGPGNAEGSSRGTINWVRTLLDSVLAGAMHGRRKIRLVHHAVRLRPRVWCFMDGSRSTGMSRCLGTARDALTDLSAQFRAHRWNLLVLRDNRVEWITKKGSHRCFQDAVARVNAASGKSYLFKSFHHLHRAILRAGHTARDRVIIVSDGLASLEPGQAHRDTPSRLRCYLRRITRANLPAAWLYPARERALVKWIEKVLGRSPVSGVKL